MNTPLLLQCAWCRLMLIGTEYLPASPVPWLRAQVSHGICPACKDTAFPGLTLAASPRLPVSASPESVAA